MSKQNDSVGYSLAIGAALVVGILWLSSIIGKPGPFDKGPPAELCATAQSTSRSLEAGGNVRFEGGGRVSIMPVAWQTLPRTAQDGLIRTAATRVSCVHRNDPREVVVTVSSMVDGREFYSGTPPL